MKTYNGNITIDKSNGKEMNELLKDVTKITGNLYINSQAKLEANNLKSVGGYLYINSDIGEELSKQLYKYNKENKYYLTNNSPEYLLEKNLNGHYAIKDVSFEKELFDKIRKDNLTAKEVFEIRNIEQRRVAYEFMDKIKMKELDGLKILEEEIDNQGNEMKIITFNIDDIELKYYNCFCPSTKREYFLETESDTCKEAKAMSFGDSEIVFDEEY